MTISLACADLGIQDCDWVVSGETPAEVVEQVVRRLRKEKGIKMPDPEAILEGDLTEDPLDDGIDEAAATIVRRLYEELDIQRLRGPADAAPAVGWLLDR